MFRNLRKSSGNPSSLFEDPRLTGGKLEVRSLQWGSPCQLSSLLDPDDPSSLSAYFSLSTVGMLQKK